MCHVFVFSMLNSRFEGAGVKQQALVNCDVMEHRRLLIELDPHDPQPIRSILASLNLPPDVTSAARVLVDGKIVSDRDVRWLRDREGMVIPVRVQCGRLLGGMQRRSGTQSSSVEEPGRCNSSFVYVFLSVQRGLLLLRRRRGCLLAKRRRYCLTLFSARRECRSI